MRESRDFLITMLQEAAPTSVGLKLPAHNGSDPLCAGSSIMPFCLYSHKVHLIPLDDQRIAFWMAQAVYLEVYVKVGPLDGFWARHLHVQHAADGCILYPRDAVVRQKIEVTQHGEYDALGVNHQYACRCAGFRLFALASEHSTHNLAFGCKFTKRFQLQAGSGKKRNKYLPHGGTRRRFVKK